MDPFPTDEVGNSCNLNIVCSTVLYCKKLPRRPKTKELSGGFETFTYDPTPQGVPWFVVGAATAAAASNNRSFKQIIETAHHRLMHWVSTDLDRGH